MRRPFSTRPLPSSTLLCCIALVLLALLAWPARAGTAAVMLEPAADRVDLWPTFTLLKDPTHTLQLADVLARGAEFIRPAVPYGNLGATRDTVWLRVPVQATAGGDGPWWFSAEYVSLDDVELFVQRGTTTLQHVAMGDRLTMSERPFPTRTHTVRLDLPPGETVDLLVRVRSTSTMILPMTLRQTARLVRDESAFQVWHGITLGFGLCVLAFGLTGMLTTRESLYTWFTWSAAAGSLFFFSYFGFTQQYLWPENAWLIQNAAPLLMLLVLVGGFMFAERSLDVRSANPRLGRAMHVAAGVVLLAAVLFTTGVVGYHTATTIASVFGPWPMLLSISVAIRRARTGDRAAYWTFVGWAIYSVGVAVATALALGRAPAYPVVQETYLITALLQIVAWVMVMNVRVAELRDRAVQTQREHDRVLLISQTDPLTGLLNRRGLQLSLQPLVAQAAPGRLTAVYLLDLDGFKPVNDRHGHDAGDELLIQMGERLKHAVRANDLVARLGGDEFVVVASQLGGDTEAELVGHKLLGCADAPFQLTHTRCEVGITVGYAVAQRGDDDPAELLRRADAAMYGGKQAGKRRVRRANVETVHA